MPTSELTACPVCSRQHRRDSWVFPTTMNRHCHGVWERHRHRWPSEEPHGHRGHPRTVEEIKADVLRGRLGVLVARLQTEMLSEKEAIAFVAGAAYEAAAAEGETWHSVRSCTKTINGLLFEGRAAKTWSMAAIERAITDVWEVL